MKQGSEGNLITEEPVRTGKVRRLHGGKVHVGDRGGNYVMRHGRRIYLGNKAYKTGEKASQSPPKYRLY